MGYMANQDALNWSSIQTGIRYGTVMAALNVSAFSVDNIKHVQRKDLDKMLKELINWTTGEHDGL